MAIFLAGVVLTLWAWLFTTSEFMPANVMKNPNFITRAGAIGAFHSIEHYEGGQSKAFVSVRRAYAYDNGLKPRPRNLFDAIGSSLTPNAIVEVVGNTNDLRIYQEGCVMQGKVQYSSGEALILTRGYQASMKNLKQRIIGLKCL